MATNVEFRALASEIAPDLGARGLEDQALMLLLPRTSTAVRCYYAGTGPPLRELADSAEIDALDAWLSEEVQFWACRWHALDPLEAGSASSTRDALVTLVTELKARQVPDAVSGLVARLVARACRTGR